MVLFCHTALINWQSPGELIIPAGRGKKLASAENGKSNAQFQLQFESRMDANEKLDRGDPRHTRIERVVKVRNEAAPRGMGILTLSRLE
jgi:hypothetical protein